MTAIELAKRYVQIASEAPVFRADFGANQYVKIDDASTKDLGISNPAITLLEVALSRTDRKAGYKVEFDDLRAGPGLYVKGKFKKLPVKQVIAKLDEIKKELGGGWERDNGNYLRAFTTEISPRLFKSASPLSYKVEGKRISGKELNELIDNSTGLKKAELLGAPAIVALTAEEAKKVAADIGFKSPVGRQR
jgi:hypothetical protein